MTKKHLVFMHQTYPAQFGPITRFLAREYDVRISFLSEYLHKEVYEGTEHHKFSRVKTGHEESPYFFSRYFEEEASCMHGVYETLKKLGITDPDLFVGHVAFGNMGLLHVAYPEVPKIGFFELFYNINSDDSRQEYRAPIHNRLRVPLRNATQLVELEYCTKGYSPTPFQLSTYPTRYQDKLTALFDGIDTNQYCPGEVTADSQLERTWPAGSKLVTYVSRGLESMRGFDIFMEVAHRVSKIRPDVHFVVAGNPKTHYGSEMIGIKESTFKDFVLSKRDFDLSRFSFLNWIPEPALVDLYRLSDCHFYWTVPFTLSWSLFQGMAAGALILGSDSAPVRDIVFNGETGVTVDPNDVDAMVDRMLHMLNNPDEYKHMRENARQLMVENYSFEVCLPKLADFYLSEVPGATLKPAAAGKAKV